MNTYRDDLEEHDKGRWSEPIDQIRLEKGPIQELPAEFRVLVFRRSADTLVHATICMSQPDDFERIELYMITDRRIEARHQIAEILTVVAHYHRTGARLGLGHSVNFGRPRLPHSACTHGLISLPYLDGPDVEWLREPKVRFLWLIPVTSGEVAFKNEHGVDALEERFEESQFNYLDPGRAPVV
jgi:hypothetical protein